jgi:thiol-disulfide isomerase/thioredoxin
MYKLVFLSLLILAFSGCGKQPHQYTQRFEFHPETPKQGEEVTIYYNPAGTDLEGAETVDMVAYLYSRDVDEALSVNMERDGDGWRGSFTTGEATRGVVVKFQAGNELADNNSKKGYIIHLYNDNGNTVPGTFAGLANGYNSWGTFYAELDKDEEEIRALLEKDFAANPEIKRDYLNLHLLMATKDNTALMDSIVAAELGAIEAAESLTEYDVEVLANWYGKIKNTEKSSAYKSMIAERFPNSDFAQLERYRAFQSEADPVRKKELLAEYEAAYPKGKYVGNMYDIIASSYVNQKDYDGLRDFLSRNKDKMTVYRFYVLSNNVQKDEAADKELVMFLVDTGIERGRAEVKQPSGEKPKFQTNKEWQENRESVLSLNLFAKGKLLTKDNNHKEALSLFEEAYALSKGENSELNEEYTRSLAVNDRHDKAAEMIEKEIGEGRATAAMKVTLKEIYVKKHRSEEGYEAYLAKYESAARENLEEKVAKEMIDLPAPGFILTDLNGRKVSLADFKGKTIVVDFWATWCGPCLNSFPGMKRSVEKYNGDEKVKFLFVNAWERVEEKKKNAEEFIKKNNYPFHVLLDDNNEVIGKFKVDGIPTKFVIDPNGRIRFKSVGFSGNTDAMVEELDLMIAMASGK